MFNPFGGYRSSAKESEVHMTNLRFKGYTEERAYELGQYTVEKNSTVRHTAKKFGISKSTVWRDLTVVLPNVDPFLAEQVADVLSINLRDRHNRGGQATKEKYRRG
jgi:putative DeoR family transcriptional regulator (stage III sporulation protein D)